VWVAAFVYGGYFFGNLPWVKDNFSIIILAIIAISVMPLFIEWVRMRMQSEAATENTENPETTKISR
jgi:membrane-associated protein